MTQKLINLPKKNFITLLFPDGETEVEIGSNIRGIRFNGKRPEGLRWNILNNQEPSKEELDWIFNELVPAMDSNSFRKLLKSDKEDNYER